MGSNEFKPYPKSQLVLDLRFNRLLVVANCSYSFYRWVDYHDKYKNKDTRLKFLEIFGGLYFVAYKTGSPPEVEIAVHFN